MEDMELRALLSFQSIQSLSVAEQAEFVAIISEMICYSCDVLDVSELENVHNSVTKTIIGTINEKSKGFTMQGRELLFSKN